MIEVRRYVTESGRDLVREWLEDIKDAQAATRIVMRMDRLAGGNLGDCRALEQRVWELKIDHGPGYRVDYAKVGETVVLLLCGGDKRKQASDIRRAIACLADYKLRTKKP